MANRFPLVLDTGDGNKIKELPAGDNLNLRENNIINVQDINALGTINAAVVTVNGEKLVAQTFAELTDTPSTYAGSEDYFVKVNEAGTGLEFRPISDIGNIDLDLLTVTEDILPAVTNTGSVGIDTQKFQRVTANELKGSLLAFDGTTVFDANTAKISYAALQGAPSNLSEFNDDVGYLRTVDLDESLASLFDEGVPLSSDLKGSVFSDDSTIIIDGLEGVIRGDTEYTGTGFIRGQTIVILADNTVQLGETELTDNLYPDADGSHSIGTLTNKFATGYFDELNVTNFQTETIGQGQNLGIGEISSSTDVSISAGNRVKINGGVPFRFSSTTNAAQMAIAAQEGDVIYNTDAGFVQVYQNSEWISLHQGEFFGNVTTASGESNFNNVVVAGNLTVSGTTTTVDTTNTTISDNVIVLNNGEVGAGVTNTTSGIEIDRGSESNVTFVWNDSIDKWTLGSETLVADTFEGAFTGDLNGNVSGNLTGNVFDNTGLGLLLDNEDGTFRGDILANDGEILLNQYTKTLRADVVGSVFGDDSTVIVDAVNNNLNADTLNVNTIESAGVLGINPLALAISSQAGISVAAGAGPFSLTSDGSAVYMTGTSGAGSISYNDSNGAIILVTTGLTRIEGAAGGNINIGTGTSGTVTIGNGSNTVDFTSGTTIDFDGTTISNFTGNVTGNIDNTTLTIGAANATSITIGNPSSSIEINGTVEFAALVAQDITADDSITLRTNGTTSGEAINLAPQGANNAINLLSDNIRFFGPVTNSVEFSGGIVGDVKGTITGDDSVILVDGVNSKIVGPVDTSSLTLNNLSDAFQSYWVMVDANGNTSRYVADPVPYVGGMLTSTGTPENTLISGTVLAQGNDIVEPNLVNATGNLRGDVVGSVFADDSSKMVDAVEFAMFSDTITLTPLNASPANITDGMIAIADGVSWDPLTTGVQTMMVYLGGAWRQIATA